MVSVSAAAGALDDRRRLRKAQDRPRPSQNLPSDRLPKYSRLVVSSISRGGGDQAALDHFLAIETAIAQALFQFASIRRGGIVTGYRLGKLLATCTRALNIDIEKQIRVSLFWLAQEAARGSIVVSRNTSAR